MTIGPTDHDEMHQLIVDLELSISSPLARTARLLVDAMAQPVDGSDHE